jgi:hypothetical protein
MAGFPPGSDAWSNEAFSFSSGSFSEYRRFLWGLDFTISIYTTAYTPTNAVGSQLDISIYDGDPNINGKLLTNFTKRSLISSITSMEEELCLEQPIEISNGGIFIIPNLRHFKSDGSFDSTVAGYEALLAGLAFNISFVSIPPVKV